MKIRRTLFAVSLVLAVSGVSLLGGQAYMRTKALAAALLIERAWAWHLIDGRPHRPWSWADTHPIARLEIPRLGVRRTVLEGASGSSLAFGLGHVSGTAFPGTPGNAAIAGHRDSWAAFLKDLRAGDEVRLQTRSGDWQGYRVTGIDIVSRHETRVLDPGSSSRLTLITCYPFDGVLRSPWRYVVSAALEPPA